MPKLCFPGGALLGCSAGFVNVPRIKGSHNAVLSGMLAAEHVDEAIAAGRAHDELQSYENAWRESDIGRDLKKVRNVKPLWSRFGTAVGIGLGGLDMWTNTLFGLSLFGTLKHGKSDATSLEPAAQHRKIDYPRPDGVLTFDRLSSVFRRAPITGRPARSPAGRRHGPPETFRARRLRRPFTRYCPAGVYEWVDKDGNSAADPNVKDVRFVINAQNCVHCKTCDIRTRTRTSTGCRRRAAGFGLFRHVRVVPAVAPWRQPDGVFHGSPTYALNVRFPCVFVVKTRNMPMRTALFAAMAAISCLCAVQPAFAGITVNTTTTTYAISGQTGYDLLKQMDRRGRSTDSHRAIAQTRYAVKWDISWKVKADLPRRQGSGRARGELQLSARHLADEPGALEALECLHARREEARGGPRRARDAWWCRRKVQSQSFGEARSELPAGPRRVRKKRVNATLCEN